MLNIYRVIALSLVTALFFAAPLLCVQPVFFQVKKARYTQAKKVRVVAQKAAPTPQIKARDASGAWARSIHPTGYNTFHLEKPESTGVGDESWDEKYRSDWHAVEEDGGTGTMGTASYSDL